MSFIPSSLPSALRYDAASRFAATSPPSAQRLSGESRHLNALRKFAALCRDAATSARCPCGIRIVVASSLWLDKIRPQAERYLSPASQALKSQHFREAIRVYVETI
jgi:hypothetical protein